MTHVLVTGGAGYIGSHTVHRLLTAGHEVSVLDDLSAGHRDALPEGVPLYEVDLADEPSTAAAVRAARPDAVVHFAGAIEAGLSMTDPARFYRVNVLGSFHLAEALRTLGGPPLVYSSSAAVYGDPQSVPIPEDAPQRPTNVYGRTKLDTEGLFAAYRSAYALRSTALRYFNAAGAARGGKLGERHKVETHLIPLALRAASTGEPLTVFGTDYPTPDGTCIRDYVHVDDLADAHVLAVAALLDGAPGEPYNVGMGVGFSVREVLAAVERVTGTVVPHHLSERRPGDPAELVADPQRIRAGLGWVPVHTSLEDIAATAHAWQAAHEESAVLGTARTEGQ
jgi:UDP-glucose 4-epimerase